MAKVRSEALLTTRGRISQQSTCGRQNENEVDRRERPAERGRERFREREGGGGGAGVPHNIYILILNNQQAAG
jgi:hypothetical protein